jgi:ABC-type phosphate transport system permease subunit
VALGIGLHRGFSLPPAVIVLPVITMPYSTKAIDSALARVPAPDRDGRRNAE